MAKSIDVEIRLEILKAILVSGSENDRRNPLPQAREFYEWVIEKKRQPGRPKESE